MSTKPNFIERHPYWAAVLPLSLVVLAWIGSRAVEAFDKGLCGSSILSTATSPDGRYIATAYEWDCGATTSFATVVGVRWHETAFDPSESDQRVLFLDDRIPLGLKWTDDSELEITGAEGAATIRKATVWNRIRISYRERAR